MIRGLIFFLLVASQVSADDYAYLQIPTRAGRGQLEAKEIYGHLAQDPGPRTFVLPIPRWKLSGGGPAYLIDQFRDTIKAGIEVKSLSEPLHGLIDLEAAGGVFLLRFPPDPDAKEILPIRWSGIYFLIGEDDFVTFGEVGDGYVVCTKDKAGFIDKRKAAQGGPGHPATVPETKPGSLVIPRPESEKRAEKRAE